MKRVAISLSVISAFAAANCGLAQSSSDTAAASEPVITWSDTVSPAAARADLAALYSGLQSAHADLYVHRSKQDYDDRYAKDFASLGKPLSRFEFYLFLQKFTAFGNVAHARIDFPMEVFQQYRDGGGRTFPIYLRIVDGRAYVGEDYSSVDGVSLGDEILAIDGRPMAEWLERTSAYLSADTPYIAHSLLEDLFPLYLWVELGERNAFDLQLRTRDGEAKDVRVKTRTRDEIAVEVDAAPEAFSLATNSRVARMATDTIAYLRPGPFYNVENPESIWDNSAFISFIDAAYEEFLENDAQALIIDLRNNPGGDNSFSDPMISWIADEPFRFASKFLIRSSDQAAASNQARLDANLGAVEGVSGQFAKFYNETPRGENFAFEIPYASPRDGERFQGDVYVLIDRKSYSNAVNAASVFQDYGWGVIAGEKTSDMATTYGAMEHFTLPETAFEVGFPKAHIIRASGDVNVDGVTPDFVIQTPIVAGAEDQVLKELLAYIVEK